MKFCLIFQTEVISFKHFLTLIREFKFIQTLDLFYEPIYHYVSLYPFLIVVKTGLHL